MTPEAQSLETTSDRRLDIAAGRLFLVSVGIGDPDNITVRAQKTLREADVIIAFQSLLEKFSELVDGKELHDPNHGLFTIWGRRGRTDGEMDALEEQARRLVRGSVGAGKTVAIMDYGDPTIFGPQSGYLREFADLNPTVIPGVSSFNAASAALATDLMSGKTSRSAILVAARYTGDDYDGTDRLELLAKTRSTLVFFTMRSELSDLVERLKRHLPAETPIAIVYHAGQTSRQAVVRETLGTILERVGPEKQPFEHLVYVGDFLTEQ